MSTNAARGARYKARSKDWLQRQGFTVFDMELQRLNVTLDGVVPTKRDQLGADLGYLARDVVVFVQVKGGAKPEAALLTEATRAFGQYAWPAASRRELHIWRPGARMATGPIVHRIRS